MVVLVWLQLKQCKALAEDRQQFARHLQENGFNQLEGTKWHRRVAEDTMTAAAVYLTWTDLLTECKNNKQRAERHKENAVRDGEGIGWKLGQTNVKMSDI